MSREDPQSPSNEDEDPHSPPNVGFGTIIEKEILINFTADYK
jgi:hypothetical protein